MWCQTCQQDVATHASMTDHLFHCPRCSELLKGQEERLLGGRATQVTQSTNPAQTFSEVAGQKHRIDAAHQETSRVEESTVPSSVVDGTSLPKNRPQAVSSRTQQPSNELELGEASLHQRRVDFDTNSRLENELSTAVTFAWGVCIAIALMSLVALFGLVSGQSASALGLLLTLMVISGFGIGYWAVTHHHQVADSARENRSYQNSRSTHNDSIRH